jgi:predicted nucleotidyltransferase
LWKPESDIDIIVYGRRNSLSVYEGLKTLLRSGERGFSPYDHDDLIRLYEFRSRDTWIPFEKFCSVERRKPSQGKFLGRDFSVRFILDWSEIGEEYGDRIYRSTGYARIKARIHDDSDSIFTPCIYRVSEVEPIEVEGGCNPNLLREIVSFRGRFSCQAMRGEGVIAQGKIEMVIEEDGEEYYRMVLGSKPSDFMIVEDNL